MLRKEQGKFLKATNLSTEDSSDECELSLLSKVSLKMQKKDFNALSFRLQDPRALKSQDTYWTLL